MDQPLFSCTKCFKTFPKSDMSKSGETCKLCNPNNSSFKQCEFCKSDFKNYIHGSICPRCQTQKYKHGEPNACSICSLKIAFGNALICQRCLHYRSKFGEPTTCQSCEKICAFIKDEESRKKVDYQILCWVCTYDFKLARNKENPAVDLAKKKSYSHSNRERPEIKGDKKSEFSRNSSHHKSSSKDTRKAEYTSDSLYNEHILTICQQQDEILLLKGQLSLKQSELIDKDRVIADLKSDIIDMERANKNYIEEVQANNEMRAEQYLSTIRKLQQEKSSLSGSNQMKKRKSTSNMQALINNPLRMPPKKSSSQGNLQTTAPEVTSKVPENSESPKSAEAVKSGDVPSTKESGENQSNPIEIETGSTTNTRDKESDGKVVEDEFSEKKSDVSSKKKIRLNFSSSASSSDND